MDMPVEDIVFLVAALVGGGFLLVTVLLDDVLSGILDIDIGGESLMPLLVSFVAMFGVGGLFATQVLDLHGGAAAAIGILSGAAGGSVAWLMFRFLRKATSPDPFSMKDLVGHDAFVAVAIPKSQWGTVSLNAEGQTHEFRATASIDIPRGETVRITGVAGSGLLASPIEDATADEPGGPGHGTAESGSDDTKQGAGTA
jgi:membrane protein implicated in regulation of membrane protease activity